MIQPSRPNPFATRPAGHFAALDVDSLSYHAAMDGISNSMLSVYLDDPELFRGYWITRKWAPPDSTREMVFGTVTHHILLDVLLEDALGKTVLEIPRDALNKDGHRKGGAWLQFAKENPDSWLFKSEEIEALREIRRSVEDHPIAAQLLFENEGVNESTIEWVDPETGLLLRSRRDRVTTFNGRRVVVDVKTTPDVSPKAFAQTCYRFDYHRQRSFYGAGAAIEFGETIPFVFVAIRKTRPRTVRCFDMGEEFEQLGTEAMKRGLADLARARDTGIWSADAGEIVTIDAPRWSKYDLEWSLSE